MVLSELGSTGAKFVIGAQGLRAGLLSNSNSIKSALIDGLKSRKVLMLRGTSEDLKNISDDAYVEFQQIGRHNYEQLQEKHYNIIDVLTSRSKRNLLLSIPSDDVFEMVGFAHFEKIIGLFAGQSLNDAEAICDDAKIARNCCGDLSNLLI